MAFDEVIEGVRLLASRVLDTGEMGCAVILIGPSGHVAWATATGDAQALALSASAFTERYTLPATAASLQRLSKPDEP